MPRTQVLRVKPGQLGYASVDAQSRNIDWTDARDEFGEGWELIEPRPTLGDISQHDSDLLTPAQVKRADANPDAQAPDSLVSEFRESDSYYEWRDGFQPMMNYVWPAFLPYSLGPQELADRLAIFAPCVSLICFGENSEHCPEEYGFAFNGGGMDLSDHMAAAYLCADQIPPSSILSGLAGVASAHMLERIGPALKAAYRGAADFHRSRAKRIGEECARVFKSKGA